MTSRTLCIAAIAVALLAGLSACESGTGGNLPENSSNPPLNPTAPPPPQPPARGETFVGALQGGMSAIGGETTGWVLRLDEPIEVRQGRAASSLEVNVDRVIEAARAFDGRRVRVTGLIVDKRYVERGVVPVLAASEIRLAE